jgi:predicted acylesterase/phospholipase RssA
LPALLASVSLPLINAVEYINGKPYTDGGIIFNMPDKIPSELSNPYPYLGINVAYNLKFRAGKVSYVRRSFIKSLALFYSHKRHQPRHAHFMKSELYDNVPLYEVVINDHLIHPTDFNKVNELIKLGYQATKEQLANAKPGIYNT